MEFCINQTIKNSNETLNKYQKDFEESSVQLVGKDEGLVSEMEQYLKETLQMYIDLRSLPEPYYDWDSLTDKWAEYERCYEMRAKNQEDRQSYEYKGASNIVLPDFHAYIEIIRTREMNALFSNKDNFEAVPTRVSTAEDALIAKRLVKHNFSVCPNFRGEIEKVVQDRLNLGTGFARTCFTVDEIKHRIITDLMVDEEGQPVVVDGIQQKELQPYEAFQVVEKKYTSLEHIDTKKVYIHTRIEKMENQECAFVLMPKSYKELREMENKGLIGEGMADYVKESNNSQIDPDVQDAEDSRSDSEVGQIDEAKVFNLFLCYYFFGEGDDRVIYEAVYLMNDKIVGLRKYPVEHIGEVIKKVCYIGIPGFAYGIGIGDEQYSSFIAKCARLNQIFDDSSFTILKGGLKDPLVIPDDVLEAMAPGDYFNVPGLSALLNGGAKPLLTWAEMERGGGNPGTEVIPILNESLQHGTGATNLLAGLPTDSEVDKTATGIQTAINAGNERINAYLAKFEDEMIKGFAITCYKNYQKFLDPKKDLPRVLDPEELYYNDENGQPTPIKFPDVLLDVDFTFKAVERVVESEKKIGKMMRLLSTISQIVAQTSLIKPQLGQMIVDNLNWKYVIEELSRNIGVGDLDKLFPNFNPIRDLMMVQAELAQVKKQSEMMGAVVGETMNRFKQTGNQAALDTAGEVMAEMQRGPQAQPAQAQPAQAQPAQAQPAQAQPAQAQPAQAQPGTAEGAASGQ